MLYVVHSDGHGFLEQSILLEFIGIHERPNKSAIRVLILVCLDARVGRLGRERPAFVGDGCRRRARGVGLAWLDRSLATLRGSLLFPRGEGAVELAIYQKICQNSTWAPWYSVGPSLDARRGLFVHEHIPTDDELISFTVVRSTETVGKRAGKTCLENEEGIFCCLNVTAPCRCTRRCLAGVHGTKASADL